MITIVNFSIYELEGIETTTIYYVISLPSSPSKQKQKMYQHKRYEKLLKKSTGTF